MMTETSNNQAFSTMPGIPERDDPELLALMEAVRRLPAERAVTFIESTVRCALGFERTGDPEFLTRSARSALGTLRVRRDPEDQKALDAVPPVREPSGDASDVDEVLARLGYS
jgi:hypothetical protein